MLAAPFLLGLLAGPRETALSASLLAGAGLAGFLGQDVARRVLRRNRPPGLVPWLFGYGAATAVLGGLLLLVTSPAVRVGLLVVAGIAVALAAVIFWAVARPTGRRFDRSVLGELVAVPALTLTGPAAAVLARGGLDGGALLVWGLCIAYFGSGVLFVKMLLDAAKRTRKGRAVHTAPSTLATVGYHVLLVAALLAALATGGAAGAWLAAAFAPVVVRTAWGLARLARPLPNMMRLGIIEATFSCWFVVAAAMALG
jgi:hypothetical protein